MKKCKLIHCLDYDKCKVSDMTRGEVKALPCVKSLLDSGFSFERVIEMQFKEVSNENS